jgi:hypothetical protein
VSIPLYQEGYQGGCDNKKISLWKCPYVILEKIRCVFIFNATRTVKKTPYIFIPMAAARGTRVPEVTGVF